MHMEMQRNWNSKTFFKKKKVGNISLFNFKLIKKLSIQVCIVFVLG